MNTKIDTGGLTGRSNKILIVFAFINATIGLILRGALGLPLIGTGVEASAVVACWFVTFCCSYVVYRSLFSLTFTWCEYNGHFITQCTLHNVIILLN
eukprot:SAG22_NODE_709_length_7742_cov_2.383488_5_plen_97_part_00